MIQNLKNIRTGYDTTTIDNIRTTDIIVDGNIRTADDKGIMYGTSKC